MEATLVQTLLTVMLGLAFRVVSGDYVRSGKDSGGYTTN